MTDLLAQTRKASEVIQSIRRLVGQSHSKVSEIDLETALNDTLKLITSEAISRQISIVTRLPEKKLLIFMDNIQLQRILINLLRNAMEAISNANILNGEIVIEIENLERSLAIHVCDNGPGIDPSIINNAIRPFYTTKDGGSGLGLWMTQLLVEANGGRLEYENNSGPGTRFSVILPVSNESN